MKKLSLTTICHSVLLRFFDADHIKDDVLKRFSQPDMLKKTIWYGVLLRLLWFFFIGHGDLGTYKYWMLFLKDLPLFESYNIPLHPADFDILPLTVIILKTITSIVNIIPDGITIPGFAQTGVRCGNLAIELFCIFLIHKKLKNPLVTFFLLFNPASIIDGYLWGQMDVSYTLLFVLSLIYFLNKKILLSGIFLGLSLTFKTQTLLFIPLFGLIVLLKKENWKAFLELILISLIVTGILYLPFMLKSDDFWASVKVSISAYGRYDFISVNAFNIWWALFAKFDLDFPGNHELIFNIISRRYFALLCFAFIYVFILIKTLRVDLNPDNIYKLFATLCFSYFMFLPEMHERYLYPFFVFFILIENKNTRWFILFWVINGFFAFNLLYAGWLCWKTWKAVPIFNLSITASFGLFLIWIYYFYTEMRSLRSAAQNQ